MHISGFKITFGGLRPTAHTCNDKHNHQQDYDYGNRNNYPFRIRNPAAA